MHNTIKLNGFSNVLDLWGFSRTKSYIWVIIAVTALLVVMEGKYNIDLLGALSDPTAVGSKAHDLSQRGKLLAAFGISWAVGRGLISKIKPASVGLMLFIALSSATYQGLDYTYTKVIANLDSEIKVKGFNLFSYRHDLLAGTLVDPDIPLPKNDPVIGKIFMGAFPIVLLDDRFMVPAQDIVERKATDKSHEVLSKAEKAWSEYDAKMQTLSKGYAQFIDASNKAMGISSADKEWSSYNTNMKVLSNAYSQFIDGSKKAMGLSSTESDWNSYNSQMQYILNGYDRFIEGSRKAAPYGARGTREFRKQSGGLDPDPNMGLTQFVSMLRSSNHPDGIKLRNAEGRVIAKRPDGKIIYGRDIPYFMSYRNFTQWHSSQAKEAMRALGFVPNPNLTRPQFLEMLRTSKHPKGEEFRKAEKRELGIKANGETLFGRDVPYFMGRDDFTLWFSAQAKETLKASGFEPNPSLDKSQFVEMLRVSKSPQGEELRRAESRELGKRPDGTPVYARDIPYFMNHENYIQWFEMQAKEAIKMAVPTTESVEKFTRIKEINAAIFLPPMAIISSLTSALTNGISLILILMSFSFSMFGPTKVIGEWLKRIAVPLMLIVFTALLYFMPSHVFDKNTPLYDLETKLHDHVGLAGKVWSKLSNIEKFIL